MLKMVLLGYVLFYDPSYYLSHPTEIIAIWKLFYVDHVKPLLSAWKRKVHSFSFPTMAGPLHDVFSFLFIGPFAAFISAACRISMEIGQGFKNERERRKFYTVAGKYVSVIIVLAFVVHLATGFGYLNDPATASHRLGRIKLPAAHATLNVEESGHSDPSFSNFEKVEKAQPHSPREFQESENQYCKDGREHLQADSRLGRKKGVGIWHNDAKYGKRPKYRSESGSLNMEARQPHASVVRRTDQIGLLYFMKKLLRCVIIFKAKGFVKLFSIEDMLVVTLFLFSSQIS